MKRLQAYKFELMPNGEQVRDMRRFAGACRFVFNRALAWQKAAYEADATTRFSYITLTNLLPEWKQNAATDWLKDAPSQTLQQALKNLERAYKNFFAKRADFPKFKRRGQGDSFRFPQGFKLEQGNSRIFLPKLGWIRYRNSRTVQGTPKNITITQSGGKWFASIQTERDINEPIHPSRSIIGIDVGITKFATQSDGVVFEPVNSFKKHQMRLARYQRAMARKVKFSKNWKKAKAKITQIYTTITNTRRDYLHKTSTTISKNHAMICIEDLQVRNMSKTAAGTMEARGRNVAAKSGLNRLILDQGWSEFRRQLEYKQHWRGGGVSAVPPKNTSRTCPRCEHVSAENRQTQAKFECVDCGYANNADIVGAINVLRAGLARLACGETVQSGRSVKQEPTEATARKPKPLSRSAVGIPAL
jgi:putative transposase